MFDDFNGAAAYKSTSVEAKASGATTRQLVLMLFDGFLDELERLEGHILEKRFAAKATSVEKLVKILGGLDASLDSNSEAEVIDNLKNLYAYSGQSLIQISLKNDVALIPSVRKIMTNLQQGWQGMP